MGDMLPGQPITALMGARVRVFVELGLAIPVCLWSAWPFYVRAVASVKNRHLNMWSLIGLGVSVAFVYRVVAALAPGAFPETFRDAEGHVAVYFELQQRLGDRQRASPPAHQAGLGQGRVRALDGLGVAGSGTGSARPLTRR